MLKFYNRENEIKLLKKLEQRSFHSAEMTFVVGRRRVGKTVLLNQTFSSPRSLYLFVEKKNESLLCQEFTKEITKK